MTVVAIALLVGSSWTLGRAALGRAAWPGLRHYERAALTLTAGLGLTALLLSLSALTGQFFRMPAVLAALSAAALGLTVYDRRHRTSMPLTKGGDPEVTGASWARLLDWMLVATAAVACLGAIAPVTDDDALTYVVPIARHIADEGALRYWADQARSMFPLSHSVLLAFVLRLGGDRLGAVTALEGLLAIGAISALARRVCEKPEHVGAALVLAVGSPVVAFQFASAKEDLLLLAATAATALCLAGRGTASELATAGLFGGMAAGAKYPGLAVAVAAVAWTAIAQRGHRVRSATIVAACAALVGGLWYGLNLWRFGNPVAPFFAGAPGTSFDATLARSWSGSYGLARGPVDALLAPLRVFLQASVFTGRHNLFNPLVYFGLGGLFIQGARRRNAPLFFTVAVLYATWFATFQNARLLLPAAALLAPSAADRLVPLRTRRGLQTAGWGVAIVSLGIVVAVGAVRVARFARAPNAYLESETQRYVDIRWMNTHLDAARHRVGSEHGAVAYLQVPTLLLDPTHETEIAAAEFGDPQRFLAACRRQGITHLFGRAGSFDALQPHVRMVYSNPASRLGGVRFFRQPPVEATAVFEILR